MAQERTRGDTELLFSFKHATERIQTGWGGRRFTENGQFTLYLREPTNIDQLLGFAGQLQDCITGLGIPATTAMDTDFALHGFKNLSMRLDIDNSRYCSSTVMHDDPDVAEAYRNFVSDTRRYHRLGTRAETPFRKNENDITHKMIRFGYYATQSKCVMTKLLGKAYQQLAMIKREMEATTDLESLFASRKEVIIASVEAIKLQRMCAVSCELNDAAYVFELTTNPAYKAIIGSVYQCDPGAAFISFAINQDELYFPESNRLITDEAIYNILARLQVVCVYARHSSARIDYDVVARDVVTLLGAIRGGNERIKNHIHVVISKLPALGYVAKQLRNPSAAAYLSCLAYRAARKKEQHNDFFDNHKGICNLFQSSCYSGTTKLSAVNKLINRFEELGYAGKLSENERKATTTKRLGSIVKQYGLTEPAAACYALESIETRSAGVSPVGAGVAL
ncbi:MAG: hypothetical protein P1U63_06255 [Coxiellaceae bacterium]|nr:hypothetical protein [Coxiellaceae bacterium]